MTNATTNTSSKVLSGSDGSFPVRPITPGTYTIEVEAPSYQRSHEENVVIAGTGAATVNVSLESGSPADAVDLTSFFRGTAPVSPRSALVSRMVS